VDELKSPVPAFGHNNRPVARETWSCAWAPDSSYFAWSCGDKIVRLIPWDRINGRLSKRSRQYSGETEESLSSQIENHDAQEEDRSESNRRSVFVIDCKENVWSVAFGSGTSKDYWRHQWRRFEFDTSLVLATGLQTGKIKLWNCVTGNLMLELLDHKDVVRSLNFCPNGNLNLASASCDGTLKLWDLDDDGNMYKTLRPGSKWIFSCRWSHDGKMLVATGANKLVAVYHTNDLSVCRKLQGHNHDVVSCEFSPDSAMLATASFDTRIIIWDPHTGDILKELGHLFPPPRLIFAGGANDHYIRGISFSCDGLQLCSVCDDSYLRVWHLDDVTDPICVAQHNNALCCAFSPNGHRISVG
ncbi:hypothetical protein FSP39_010709, partial [Pinctada imbricata]